MPALELQAFWGRADLVFLSSVAPAMLYSDVATRLRNIGLSPADLLEHGAAVLIASQFFDAGGHVLKLSKHLTAYEPAISLPLILRARQRHVVLDRWGAGALPRGLLASGFCTALFLDADNAERVL